MSMTNKKISILGAGESGVGAALLAAKQGYEVFVSDRGPIREKYKAELEQHGIPYEEGRHSEERISEGTEIVKSPGIPDEVPLVRALRTAGKAVISEIEFAARFTEALLIGITGTNGKTTTTQLTYHLLREGGPSVGMAGNVGNSFARLLAEEAPKERYVLELSSFQLDGIEQFRPHIAMLLNISPDHLDRYEYKFENYVAAKFRIMRNQKMDDVFLFNGDDETIGRYLKRLEPVPQLMALTHRNIEGERLHLDHQSFDLSGTALKGRHNAMNALFAIAAARLLGVRDEKIQQALKTFVNVPHRMERVAEIAGVTYYNDSKATNVDSAYYALEAMQGSVIWIAGGQDKGNDYSLLLPLVREKVKAVVCLGLDNEKIKGAFQNSVDILKETKSAEEAVQTAARLAETGDVVLLSPACASFDLFRNYEDRGEQFKKAVNSLEV